MNKPETRGTTPLDEIAEEWLSTELDLRPELRVRLGVGDDRSSFTDWSPEGAQARAAAARRTLRQACAEEPRDAVDVATKAELVRVLQLDVAQYESGLWRRDLNVIESPAQQMREVFDSMPISTHEDWFAVARRMQRLPEAMSGYVNTLRSGAQASVTPAVRQVRAVSAQAARLARRRGFFDDLAARADGPPALAAELKAGARAAHAAFDHLRRFLDEELLPVATRRDAVGRDHYALACRGFVGVEIDLDETYAWGLAELDRLTIEQSEVVDLIAPGGSVDDAVKALEDDPRYQLEGTAALERWMQEISDQAIEVLGGSHFDIPEPLRTLECRIAPTRGGGIYYTEPSDDFSRPGRMWWSPTEGLDRFATWRELTTVYHEGVPGHHLQCGAAIHNRAELNMWRRNNWNAGHGEGWALYAERLMAELGYLDDPANRLGMLSMQCMRAARVVIDIGLHTEQPRPDGQGQWTSDYALGFLLKHSRIDAGMARFEIDRYLGWPGQAPSYKLGQRLWEELRDDWLAEGRGSLRAFHRSALAMGSIGLGTLRAVLLP
jgi:uncharacterized protein (DUF885 family)